jgi:hypothetical protein
MASVCVRSRLLVLILEFCFDGLAFLETAWPEGGDIDGFGFAVQQELCHDQTDGRRNFEAHARKTGYRRSFYSNDGTQQARTDHARLQLV